MEIWPVIALVLTVPWRFFAVNHVQVSEVDDY